MNARAVTAAARAAARERRAVAKPLVWSDARLDAPWGRAGLPDEWEGAYRTAYAKELVKLGHAKGSRSGTPGYATTLERRPFSATAAELAKQDERARTAGLSWSAWARRKLSDP